VQTEEDSACVLLMGPALAEGPKEHPWLMSLAPTGAIMCQCAQKIKTSGGKKCKPLVGKETCCAYDKA